MIIAAEKINKFPIIIMSSPRTGSTSLAYDICQVHPNLKLFNENLTHAINSNESSEISSFIKNDKNYILKFHLGDINKYPEIDNILNDAYLIRIRRHNVLEQIVSFYIELHRNIWGYYKNSYASISDTIPLDNRRATGSISTILSYNAKLNKCKYNFDLDVYYEDLSFTNDELRQTPKPLNYMEVCEFIKQKLPKTLIES